MQLQEEKRTIDKSDLTCWYQPIYEIRDNVLLGYEALMRSEKYRILDPLEVFHKAQLLGEYTILDRHLIIKAQQLFRDLKEYSLFINIFPSNLLERDFIFWWDRYSEKFPNVVLELSENEYISNWQSFMLIIKELKERNINIAVDDMGMGYSSLRYWIELEPEYIKLDRYYMIGILSDIKKQSLIESLINLVGDSTPIVFEGIEDIETLKLAKDLGACYAQGYLLGNPSPISNIINNNLDILL